MKKIKIDTFQDKVIYFDKVTEEFSCGNIVAKSLYEIKKRLEIESKTDFTGNFFITDYNGIKRFTARKRFYSDYDDEWKVRGIETDTYGSKRDETVSEKALYPQNEANEKVFQEAEKLRSDGWSLIHRATKKAIELQKG